MPKRVSSKMARYIKPSQLPSPSQERSQINEGAIEEMAKIFMQTQANMANNNKPQTNHSQEVLDLLHQINSKLENLHDSLLESNSPADQSQQDDQQSGQNQITQQQQPLQNAQTAVSSTSNSAVSEELRKLFGTLLTTGGQANTASSASQTQNANGNNAMQQQDQNSGQNKKNNSSIAVQTAAQVLSQAQYELSNELEASLQSLKQVISESEKIANKISNLLGEENNQKQ